MIVDVDVDLTRGERAFAYRLVTSAAVTGVFGPSGGGKTTLLHLIAGLLRPSRGHIRLGDTRLVDTEAGVFVPVHRRRIGVVFQDGRLFPHRSVRGNLRYARERGREGRAGPSFDDVVDILQLASMLQRSVTNLSGGERQRVALGRVLLSAPRLLLLDEPLASVDRDGRDAILAYMVKVRDAFALPMLYVSHDLTEIRRLADDIAVVTDGRIVATGPVPLLAGDARAWSLVREPANILRTTVAGHDPSAGLTTYRLAGPPTPETVRTLVGPLAKDAVGTPVMLALGADDVSLAPAKVPGISIRNQLPGRIRRLHEQPDRIVVEIDLAGHPLLVEVSHATVKSLGLTAGDDTWCLIKSNALRRS